MRVSVLVVDGVFDSGLATVRDVLAAANLLRAEVERPPAPVEVAVVGARRRMVTASGARIDTVAPDAPDGPPDVMVVPALGLHPPETLAELASSARLRPTVELVARSHAAGVALAAACSGTLLMAESGVLDGREATTSWWLEPVFRARHPQVRLDVSATLVTDGGVTTAGAAFAHIDLALSLVASQSPALADLVARFLLIGEKASQSSVAAPTVIARRSPEMSAFERWVRAHLDGPIRITAAAAAIGVSERTLQRVTAAATGMSPLAFVNEVRLDEAAFLLRSSALSVEAVAARVGFRNAGTLRALVRRRRGTTLGALRRPPGRRGGP